MGDRKIQFLGLLCSILLSTTFAQTPLSQDPAYTKVFENLLGCSGFDIKAANTTQENLTNCAVTCNNNPACHGFSYNPSSKDCRPKVTSFCMNQGLSEPGYAYYTRNAAWSVDRDQELKILTYGYKKVADGDCTESDLGGYLAEQKDSLSNCAEWCNRVTNCMGVSYSHVDGKCVLKAINECALQKRERGYYQFYGRIGNLSTSISPAASTTYP